MITNRQKALIHVARNRVGMSEGDYRAMLEGFGVTSSRDLTQAKFEGVMRHFGKLGFQSRLKAPREKVPTSRELLRGKVRAFMVEAGLRDGYIDAMARHMFQVDSWLWLDAHQLHKIVAALTYHRRRKTRAAKAE